LIGVGLILPFIILGIEGAREAVRMPVTATIDA